MVLTQVNLFCVVEIKSMVDDASEDGNIDVAEFCEGITNCKLYPSIMDREKIWNDHSMH